MGHTIELSEDGRYILLTVKGDTTRRLATQWNTEAHTLGRQLGIDKYLADLTESRNPESTLDQYDFAYRDMQQAEGIDRFAHVVVLVAPDDHSHDFIETVCKNAGFDVTLFRDRDQAMQFIRENWYGQANPG